MDLARIMGGKDGKSQEVIGSSNEEFSSDTAETPFRGGGIDDGLEKTDGTSSGEKRILRA